MNTTPRRRARTERPAAAAAVAPERDRGSAPFTLTLGVALVLIPLIILVLTIPTWMGRSIDARDAAANAARTLATAPTWTAGTTAANQTVTEIATNNNLPTSDLTVTYTGKLAPGGTVTAHVTVTIPAAQLPGLGTSIGTVHYTASSTQHVDTYEEAPS